MHLSNSKTDVLRILFTASTYSLKLLLEFVLAFYANSHQQKYICYNIIINNKSYDDTSKYSPSKLLLNIQFNDKN